MLLNKNLIQVKPHGLPRLKLMYMDFTYETLLELRIKKIKKIKNKISL